jgi:hypothetical protein
VLRLRHRRALSLHTSCYSCIFLLCCLQSDLPTLASLIHNLRRDCLLFAADVPHCCVRHTDRHAYKRVLHNVRRFCRFYRAWSEELGAIGIRIGNLLPLGALTSAKRRYTLTICRGKERTAPMRNGKTSMPHMVISAVSTLRLSACLQGMNRRKI